ncbi:MAG: CPBP family intramembrane glutamic endopeptidase, partial [Pseudomonadota bacterium]
MPRSLYPDLIRKTPVFAPAYRAWVGAGRRRTALWRTLLGLGIIAVCWTETTFFVIAVPVLAQLMSGQSFLLKIPDSAELSGAMGSIPGALQSILILLSFTGVWLGVWLAARLLHRRSMASILAARGRWRSGQFWAGFAVAAGFSLMMALLVIATDPTEMIAEADPFAWGLYLLPLAIAVAIQSCGEEVLFRGYLQQQLAARIRAPWVWLILPAVLFGLLHGGEGWHGVGYVLI